MKSVVGVYDSHDRAVSAIKQLQGGGYPVHQISILGQGEIIRGEARVKSVSNLAAKEIGVGAVVGSILGVLTGVGVFAIPGMGFLFGAGALFGAFTGFEAGLLGGGVMAVLTAIGIDLSGAARYEQHLNEGKFMVIIQGNLKEIDFGKKILESHGDHVELNDH